MKFGKCFLTVIIFCAGFAAAALAADPKAGRYDSVYAQEPLTSKNLKDPFSRAIAFPFELLKWPMDKGAVLTEKYRIDKKAKWIYEKSVEYGVTPHLDSMDTEPFPAFGATFDMVSLARRKDDHPDLILKTAVRYGPKVFFQVASELGKQRILDTGFYTSGIFQYEMRENETFYGIGPNTSLGDSTSYKKETTSLGIVGGYEFSPVWNLASKFVYDHVNIGNRAHDGKGDIRNIFAGQDIPGLYGDDLLGYSLGLTRDTRDSKDFATRGSYQKLLFKFTEGVNGSPARYFTYQVDAAKYFRIASPRRIFVTRIFGESNDAVNDGTVPFYNMTKLGGSGTFPRLSQTERAFVFNRFYGKSAVLFNLEYRYTVWEYRDFKMSTSFFWDQGETSKDSWAFRLKDLRESYGIGFYVTYAQNMLLDFSVAHGDEGTRFYVKNKLPF
ncbi:MAG TPA: BamA/TamA family outer membrane protein [Candidatus Omnitrophota bacterium]|nr:BamA/TamA family outer membrane protein [Candidatus Omnitrophota bacterium]HPS36542.1 BamA/TamA family outer membrane protein [Candidatus Omnitrophota bacterium]